MTLFEKIWLAVELLGGLGLLLLTLDAVVARPVYPRTRLAEPDAADYIGHHSPEYLGGGS